MIRALSLSFSQLGDPAIRRVLIVSLIGALVLSILLPVALGWGVSLLNLAGIGWVDGIISALGSVAGLVLAWLLFPAVVTMIASLFVEDVSRAVERRHYPALPPPFPSGLWRDIVSGLRMVGLAIALNLLALPLYLFLPILNIAIFLVINGWLLGREYMAQVAMRRLSDPEVTALWQTRKFTFLVGGVVIAGLSIVPVLNLLVPVIGTAFMTHLFEGVRPESRLAGISPR